MCEMIYLGEIVYSRNHKSKSLDKGGQMSSFLTIIHIADNMMMLLFCSVIFPLLCAPQDCTKIKKRPALLVVHILQIGLLAEEKREGGNQVVVAKKGLAYAPLVPSYLQRSLSTLTIIDLVLLGTRSLYLTTQASWINGSLSNYQVFQINGFLSNNHYLLLLALTQRIQQYRGLLDIQ